MTHMKLKAVAAAFFLSAPLLAAGLAPGLAQDAAQPDPAPQATETPQGEAWIKLCNMDEQIKKEICVVTQELRDGNSGGLLASVTVRLVEGEKVGMIVAVPVGMLLRPGIQIRVDENEPKSGQYNICFPNACVASVDIDDAYVAQMKRGNQLQVAVIRPDEQPFAFPLTLTGFTKTFDGPPLDPEEFEESQKKLEEELTKRAEEARRKAEQEQQQKAE